MSDSLSRKRFLKEDFNMTMTTTVLDDVKKGELTLIAKEIMSSKENILKNVFYRLLPSKRCLDRVSETFLGDMSKVYAIRLTNDEEGSSSIVLTWEMADSMGIDFEEINAHAEENTPKFSACTIRPMMNVLFSLMGSEELEIPQDMDELYVISNEGANYGAASICYPNVLEEIARTLKGSFWLLPSSVHELIALMANMSTSDALRAMVKEVNDNIVDECDLLSYEVMFYDANVGTLEIV